jgi:RNA polymerase sigma-70 factor (ECF subfamily)
MEDKKLLRLLYKNPSEGMEQLMNQYTGLVYAVVKGKLSNFYHVSSDIEDCVADVFSNFYMKLSDYDPSISCIRSYLCVIARHQAINMARKRRFEELTSPDDDESYLILSDEESPEDVLVEKETRAEVIKAVESLGPPDSVIIFRKFYYGQSSKEIADLLGMSVSNVNSRTSRALNKLRKLFGGNRS